MNEESVTLILEKLDAIEARLLGMETVSQEGLDPQVAVHLLFRDFHNLKSALSMNGADITAKLVHEAESCLDALRSGNGNRESSWVDILLAVVDHARKVMLADEDYAAPSLSSRLGELLESWIHHSGKAMREIGFPLEAAEAERLKMALSAGLSTYTLEKLVGETMEPSDVDGLPVFEAIAEAGTMIARRLIRVKGSGSVLTIVFATDKSRDDLSFILFDPFYPVSGSSSEVPVNRAAKLKRILIVDDEAIALMLLQHYLSPYGRLDTAEDGNEAIGKFESALTSGDPYSIIFLDIMIPGISGNDVLGEIRKQEEAAGIPPSAGAKIVMESSLSDYSSISTSFKNQSDAYLVKPIDSNAIDKTMQKFGLKKIVFP